VVNHSTFGKPLSDLLFILSSPSTTSTQYKPWCQGKSCLHMDVGGEMVDDMDGGEGSGLCLREGIGEDVGW
jgi:hypothetical protein